MSGVAILGRALRRRETLALLGAAAATLLARRWRRPDVLAAECVLRPEQTEGPYFVEAHLRRSDIRADPGDGSVRPGRELALTFRVSALRGAACTPLAGAVVDVWQCDADGVYSDVRDWRHDTRGKKFLRGHQVTDADGAARFVTIWPGWYPGRTVHIHFRIRTAPDAAEGLTFTSQLYFDDAQTDAVHATAPYAARGPRPERNPDDGLYRRGGDRLLLAPVADGRGGFSATFPIALDLRHARRVHGRACRA